MTCWLIGCLVPGFPPHWRVALLTIPFVAFGLLSVPDHYSRYVLALAVGAVVMLMGKLAEKYLQIGPVSWQVTRRITVRRPHRSGRKATGRSFTPGEAPPRRRSEIPPL